MSFRNLMMGGSSGDVSTYPRITLTEDTTYTIKILSIS